MQSQTLFISRPTLLSVVENGVTSEVLVHFISTSSDLQKSVAYLRPYSDREYNTTFFDCTILKAEYAYLNQFNWQASDQAWREMNPVERNGNVYSITNLNLASVITNITVILRITSFRNQVTNLQRRVIYVGYWISNADVPSLVAAWQAANITHVLFTFVTQFDYTQPLSEAYSMTLAFKELSSTNQDLLVDNFVVGVSYGGAAAMPVPYSNTFDQPTSYYGPTGKGNGAAGLAADLIKICGTKLNRYYDLDIEGISQIPDNTPTVNFLGSVCQALKEQNPLCVISHAPQTPYFDPAFGSVYLDLYQSYSQYFDWYNIQYYNNGPSDTYQEIFVQSTADWPNTAVTQLINAGIAPGYIVVGKPVNADEGNAGGYVPLPTLATYFNQAFQSTTTQLQAWSQSTGGSMIWYYNTQATSGAGNTFLNSYVKTVFNPQPAALATDDNQSLLTFMNTISQL